MSMGEIRVNILPDLSRFTAAVEAAASAMRNYSQVWAKMTRRIHWQTRFAAAQTPKELRLVARDWARENRCPAVIHNGRKPR